MTGLTYRACDQVNARKNRFDRIFLENIIILTQIRDMFHDLEFDSCIVSCGTCMESLNELGLPSVFDCEIQDISGYIMENMANISSDNLYLYHTPCHDSLKDEAAPRLLSHGIRVQNVPHCCSEAGTLSISRPDISHAMFLRKQKSVEETESEPGKKRKILTNCPSCIQGLGRQPKLAPIHLAEELALLTAGEDWAQAFKELVKVKELEKKSEG